MKPPSAARAVAAGLVAVAMLAMAGCGDDAGDGANDAPQASIPAGDGPIEPGTYRIPTSAWSVTDFSVTFPEGWTVQYGHVYAGYGPQDEEFGFYAVVVDEIFAEACKGSEAGAPTAVGPTSTTSPPPLLQQPGPKASGPFDTTLGGSPATRVDLTVPEGFDLSACNAQDIGLQVWFSAPAEKNFVLPPDGPASVYILDVDGERQVFLTQHDVTTSAEDLAELQAVLDSIRIGA